MIFLVQYDRRSEKLLRFDHFSDDRRSDAEQARLSLELSGLGHVLEQEVVLLEADSAEALLRTHGRYFQTLAEIVTASGIETTPASPC